MSDDDVTPSPQPFLAGYSQGAATSGDVLPHLQVTSASDTDCLPVLRLQWERTRPAEFIFTGPNGGGKVALESVSKRTPLWPYVVVGVVLSLCLVAGVVALLTVVPNAVGAILVVLGGVGFGALFAAGALEKYHTAPAAPLGPLFTLPDLDTPEADIVAKAVNTLGQVALSEAWKTGWQQTVRVPIDLEFEAEQIARTGLRLTRLRRSIGNKPAGDGTKLVRWDHLNENYAAGLDDLRRKANHAVALQRAIEAGNHRHAVESAADALAAGAEKP